VDSSSDQNLQKPTSIVTGIVRYLASRPGIGPGSRVLLCGVSNAVLIQGLTNLGLLVTCTNEDQDDAESLQQNVPEADCCEGNVPREQFYNADAGFDLVVVSAAERNECFSIFSRYRMMELASRMACIQPGGFFVQLGSSDSADGFEVTHSMQCCLRQVSVFPGQSSARSFSNQFRLRYPQRSSPFAISLQIPDQRLSPFEWDVLAMNASKRLPVECCQFAADRHSSDNRHAA